MFIQKKDLDAVETRLVLQQVTATGSLTESISALTKQFEDLKSTAQEVEVSLDQSLTNQHDIGKSVLSEISNAVKNITSEAGVFWETASKTSSTQNQSLLDLIGSLTDSITSLKEVVLSKTTEISDLENKFTKLSNETDSKLNDFYKEFTDRYFENLAAFMRWNKEISLVSHFTKGKDLDLTKLKTHMEKPIHEAGFMKQNAHDAMRINEALASKGEKVRKAWESYRDEKLALERQGDKVDKVRLAIVNAKLEVLNKLVS